MRRLIRLLLCAVLAFSAIGCAGSETVRTETVEVLVPVATPPPAPPETQRPALPIAELDSTSRPADVMRAYAASVQLLMGYARELETILDTYRPNQ